ncbi:MAG: hypothetical protein ABIJ61_01810 [bacterium]
MEIGGGVGEPVVITQMGITQSDVNASTGTAAIYAGVAVDDRICQIKPNFVDTDTRTSLISLIVRYLAIDNIEDSAAVLTAID